MPFMYVRGENSLALLDYHLSPLFPPLREAQHGIWDHEAWSLFLSSSVRILVSLWTAKEMVL